MWENRTWTLIDILPAKDGKEPRHATQCSGPISQVIDWKLSENSFLFRLFISVNWFSLFSLNYQIEDGKLWWRDCRKGGNSARRGLTSIENPTRCPKLMIDQFKENPWSSNNWTPAVVNTPINDVIAHRDIGAGKSPKVEAYLFKHQKRWVCNWPKQIDITQIIESA